MLRIVILKIVLFRDGIKNLSEFEDGHSWQSRLFGVLLLLGNCCLLIFGYKETRQLDKTISVSTCINKRISLFSSKWCRCSTKREEIRPLTILDLFHDIHCLQGKKKTNCSRLHRFDEMIQCEMVIFCPFRGLCGLVILCQKLELCERGAQVGSTGVGLKKILAKMKSFKKLRPLIPGIT